MEDMGKPAISQSWIPDHIVKVESRDPLPLLLIKVKLIKCVSHTLLSGVSLYVVSKHYGKPLTCPICRSAQSSLTLGPSRLTSAVLSQRFFLSCLVAAEKSSEIDILLLFNLKLLFSFLTFSRWSNNFRINGRSVGFPPSQSMNSFYSWYFTSSFFWNKSTTFSLRDTDISSVLSGMPNMTRLFCLPLSLRSANFL